LKQGGELHRPSTSNKQSMVQFFKCCHGRIGIPGPVLQNLHGQN
jgi:hypothetical protein